MNTLTKPIQDKMSSLKTLPSVSSVLNGLQKREKIDKLFIVLLDCSFSMSDNIGNQSKIEAAWKVFQSDLIPNLNEWTFGIMTFGNVVDWLIFPGKRDILAKQPSLCGSTSMGIGLKTAWKFINSSSNSARIILLTDGEPTDMPKPEIIEMVQFNSSIPIDTVAIGEGTNYDPIFLRQLSEITGGIFCEANSVSKLKDIIVKLSPIHRPLLGMVK